MPSTATLEQYLSFDTNFDPPYFSLDNTFKTAEQNLYPNGCAEPKLRTYGKETITRGTLLEEI
jgi:hypothetical protein